MLFNSIEFLIFLPLVFAIYWGVFRKKSSYQNGFIVLVSYFFYGWWDWRFLFLIGFSSLLDFIIGQRIHQSNNALTRKRLLSISLFANLGLLGFFKYCNFFLDSFSTAFTFLGTGLDTSRLDIILPVGISFYTFQTLSYTIDIYRKKLEPSKDWVSFMAFVSFFPQLVAGPIERATNLLPQFYKKRTFDYHQAVDGLRQILWGLFKKVVIADSCAEMVNWAFLNSETLSGSSMFLAAVFFSFQIYGDFSGYSDMAIGIAKLFGFKLMQNFAFPYFSRDIAEFWRRWHISLSTWFRDYVYIPLGGSKMGVWGKTRNIFVIFLISGFWHGANWTFIVWGLIHAICFLPLMLRKRNRKHLQIVAHDRKLPTLKELRSMLFTFSLVSLAWIFFRADNMGQAMEICKNIFSVSLFEMPEYVYIDVLIRCVFVLIIFLVIEWIGRREQYAIEKIGLQSSRFIRWSFYAAIVVLIGMFAKTEETPFIYFQF